MLHPSLLASLALAFLPQVPGSASDTSWADFDADGRPDLLWVGPGGVPRLFLAGEYGGLRAAGEDWGLRVLGPVLGAVPADFDGDGLPDLALVGADGALRLLRNSGASLDDVTELSGLANLAELSGVQWVDYDEDSRPDLVVRTRWGSMALARNLGGAMFDPISLGGDQALLESWNGIPAVRANAPGASEPGEEAHQPGAGQRAGDSRSLPTLGGGVSGNSTSIVTVGGPAGPEAAAFACAPTVADAASGACIPASSEPLLGHLLPLGPYISVIPGGNVGLGTETPATDLHVVGGTNADLRLASYSSFAQDYVSRIEMGDLDFVNGMLVQSNKAAFNIYSRRNSQGGPITVGPHLSIARQDATSVGIGTATPATTLDVDGDATVRGDIDWRRPDGSRAGLFEHELFGGNAARLTIFQDNGSNGVRIDGQQGGAGGKVSIYRSNGQPSIEMDGDDLGVGYMRFYKADNSIGVLIDPDFGGSARIRTEVLEITGGADLVESFDTGDVVCEPGTVVVIDETRPGELTPSSEAYDRRVAGIVSGAGGVKPGLHMGQDGVADGSTPVALTGRVFVRCNAEGGAVRPGDMLTSSSTPGEAMRVNDAGRAFGAVIGKAMTALDEDSGLVLVLVSLQ